MCPREKKIPFIVAQPQKRAKSWESQPAASSTCWCDPQQMKQSPLLLPFAPPHSPCSTVSQVPVLLLRSLSQ